MVATSQEIKNKEIMIMPVMNIKNLSFTYPGVSEQSLKNITLPIEKN